MTDVLASPMEANMDRSLQQHEAFRIAAAALKREALKRQARGNAQATAIRGSGERLDLSDEKQAKAYQRRAQVAEWHKDAWRYYRNVPEMGFGGRFFGNAMSKIRLVAAIIPEDGSAPIPLRDYRDDDGNLLLPESEIQAAEDAVARLARTRGGHAELLRSYAVNMWVAGDCTLLGLQDEDAPDGERWLIASTSELKVEDRKAYLLAFPGQPTSEATPIPDDTPKYRLWVSDPEWQALPDAPMRRVLEVCDELQILTRAIRSGALSRVPRGVLVIPESATKGPEDQTLDAEDDGEAKADPTIAGIVEHFVTSTEVDGSAGVVAPYVLVVPDDVVDKVQYLEIGAVFSADEARVRDELVRRAANGVDLPTEILLGLADVNHWGIWAIDEMTFKSFVEPYCVNFCGSASYAYYRPALRAQQVQNPERHVIWYDPADLIGHPDQAAAADKGLELGVIGPDTWRRVRNFSENDAPTDEELAEMLAFRRSTIDPTITSELLSALGILIAASGGAGQAAVPTTATEAPASAENVEPAPPAITEAPTEPEPVVAAANPRLERLGYRLAAIDHHLRQRLLTAADAAMRRTLERAGAKLRTKALRASIITQDVIDRVPNERVAAHLGAALVADVGVDLDDLLEGSFDDLRDRFESWTSRAQAQALGEISRAAPLPADQLRALEARQAEDRSAAWVLLVGLLKRQAREVLFDPTPSGPEVGEFDGTVTVQAGIIRQALSRAGGASGPTTRGGAILVGPAELPAGGVATGPAVIDTLATIQIRTTGYEWVYGDPGSRQSNFEPHEALDGIGFSSFQDPVLANPGSWPPVAYFSPGDHFGCQCDFVPRFTEGAAEEADLVSEEA